MRIPRASPRRCATEGDDGRSGFAFFFVWVLASAGAWAAGPFLVLLAILPVAAASASTPVSDTSGLDYAAWTAVAGLILGAVLGVWFGFVQSRVAAGRLGPAKRWIASTVVSAGISMPLGALALRPLYEGPTWTGGPLAVYLFLIAWLVPGIVVGIAQWRVLRESCGNAWLWVIASAFAWPFALVFLSEGGWSPTAILAYVIVFAALGVLVGAVSGGALLAMSRSKKGPAGTARFPL